MIEQESQIKLKSSTTSDLDRVKETTVSRYNAQKHSILRITPTEYESANQEELYNSLADDLKPIGRLQESIIEIIASNLIKLQRISKAEAEAIKEALSPMVGTEFSQYPSMVEFKSYQSPVSSEIADRLMLFSRYQTATENRLYRAMVMYKQLKYEQS